MSALVVTQVDLPTRKFGFVRLDLRKILHTGLSEGKHSHRGLRGCEALRAEGAVEADVQASDSIIRSVDTYGVHRPAGG